MMTNKLRKERLAAIVRDRLGYQEYLDMRDALDKTIATLYDKLQKKSMPKASKKKKKSGEMNGFPAGASVGPNGVPNNISALPPCPAALGLETDSELHLGVPEQLTRLVQTRRKWVDEVGRHFVAMEEETPGRIYGLPRESIFQGIEEEVRKYVVALPPTIPTSQTEHSGPSALPSAQTSSGKGKARALGDDMQLG